MKVKEDKNIVENLSFLHKPFAVEAVSGTVVSGRVNVARRRPLSASVGPAVRRLLLDVLPARRQLGLQVLRAKVRMM